MFQNNREYYEKQTKQDDNIVKITESLHIEENMNIVDLGTGPGYIGFLIAELYPDANVIGVDILEKTLKQNEEYTKKENKKNIKFIKYDGVTLPLENELADVLVTRFALHHFVDIEKSFVEFSRVLKSGGQLFICDPTPDELDRDKIIDKFMQLAPDGHVSFIRWKNMI